MLPSTPKLHMGVRKKIEILLQNEVEVNGDSCYDQKKKYGINKEW